MLHVLHSYAVAAFIFLRFVDLSVINWTSNYPITTLDVQTFPSVITFYSLEICIDFTGEYNINDEM